MILSGAKHLQKVQVKHIYLLVFLKLIELLTSSKTLAKWHCDRKEK